MKKNRVYFQIGITIITLFAFYIIWPLPFKYISKNIIIPFIDRGVVLVSKAMEPIRTVGKIQTLDDENKKLEDENLELKAKIIAMEEQKNKCVSQIDERKFAQKVNVNTIQASVIGKSPFSFNQVFVINKGFNEGVREKTAVLAKGYLLGQIIEVTHKDATVKLLTGHDSLIPAMTIKSRQSGIVQGGLAGLSMTDVPVDAKIEESEAVVTSGMGGDLPFGIPIGKISSIQVKSDKLFKNIKIDYPVNTNNVEVVSVVINDESS